MPTIKREKLAQAVRRYLDQRAGKIDAQSVLYFEPSEIGDPAGAACGRCMMFLKDTSECSILKPAAVDGETGVCGFYIHGESMASEDHPPMKLISADTAGYTEDGPTHCGNCRYYGGGNSATGPCAKVQGTVEFQGCCNAWENASRQ